jgi:hypothetical protein
VGVAEILLHIDREISRLQKARTLLNGNGARLKVLSDVRLVNPGRKKRNRLSPEGRKRIAEAQKRRWAKERKTGK